MKIAIICQVEKRQAIGKIAGGIQAVEQLQARLLHEMGHEVHFITTDDSDDVFPTMAWMDRGIKTVKLGGPSEEAGEADGTAITKQARGKQNRFRSGEIESYLHMIDPDLTINHSFSSSQLKLCVRFSKSHPVISFLHCTPESASDMSLFTKLEGYMELNANGSALMLVSEYQRDRWREFLKRRLASGSPHFASLKTPENIDQVFKYICKAAIIPVREDVYAPNNYFIVVGRPEKDKNIGKLLEGLVKIDSQHKIKIYIAFPGKLEDSEYYNTRMKDNLEKLGDRVELCCNQPRSELLGAIARAKAAIVPCLIEACPVVPIEAMSFGVKTIAFCMSDADGKLHHACINMLGRDCIPVSVKKEVFLDDLKAALDNQIYDNLIERTAVRDIGIAKYGKESLIAELKKAMCIVSNYTTKRKTPTLLEF